jgi:hypothetical protein
MTQQPKILFSVKDLAVEIERTFQDYLNPTAEGYYFGYAKKPTFLLHPPRIKKYGEQAPEMHFTVYKNGKPLFIPMYHQLLSNGQQVPLTRVEDIQASVYDTDGELVFAPSKPFLELSPENKKDCFSKKPRMPVIGYQIVKDFVDYHIDVTSMWVTRVTPLIDRINKHFRINTHEVAVNAVESMVFDSGRRMFVDVLMDEVSREDPLGTWAEEKIRLIMMPLQEDLQRFICSDHWNIYNTRILHDMLIVEKGPDYRIEQWEKEHGSEYRVKRKRR